MSTMKKGLTRAAVAATWLLGIVAHLLASYLLIVEDNGVGALIPGFISVAIVTYLAPRLSEDYRNEYGQ